MESTFSMSPGVFKYSSHIKPSFGTGSLSATSGRVEWSENLSWQGNDWAACAGYEGGGDMMSLDEEISHLQKENSQVDSQLHRMKSDVGGMETEAASDDKVGEVELLKQR